MTLSQRLEAVEEALAKRNGESGLKLVVRADCEAEEEARERAGLADWPGLIICLDAIDEKA